MELRDTTKTGNRQTVPVVKRLEKRDFGHPLRNLNTAFFVVWKLPLSRLLFHVPDTSVFFLGTKENNGTFSSKRLQVWVKGRNLLPLLFFLTLNYSEVMVDPSRRKGCRRDRGTRQDTHILFSRGVVSGWVPKSPELPTWERKISRCGPCRETTPMIVL